MLFDTNLFPRVLQESYFHFSGADYMYFDEKVEFYSLNYRSRKIQSFQELIYCMEVVLHLNPDIEWEEFIKMALWVSDRTNGKTIRTYGETNVTESCVRVYDKKRKPYVNNYRRVIFNPAKIIDKSTKMSIVGKVCGGMKRRIDTQKIYDVVEEMMGEGIKIRLKDVALSLGVTQQTITNHVTEDIKDLIKEYNKTI
jgi:hypothetical protein